MVTPKRHFAQNPATARWLSLSCLLLAACGIPSPAVLVDRPDLRVASVSVGPANVFIVDRNGVRMMIDAANPGDEEAIEDNLAALEIDPSSIDYLILTHGHIDHAGTAAHFRNKYGIKVVAGVGDEGIIADHGRADICPTSALARFIRWAMSGRRYEPFAIDIPIDADFDLAELGVEGQVLHLQGHTEGSIAILFDDQYFVGDQIRGGLLRRGQPTTHFFMCDLAENRAKLRTLIERNPVARWYPGHFGPFDARYVADYLARQSG